MCIKGCSAVFHSLKLYKNQMYTSNLLKMQVWDTNLQQTTGLLIIKIPVELFSQCVLFLWRREKKVIWNWATFILSSLVNMLPQQPSSCYLGKDRCLCFNQNAKLREAKKKRFGGEQWKFIISLFEMWIALSWLWATVLTHSILQYVFKSFTIAILHFH